MTQTFNTPLIFVTGKGGVGKSALTAALGLWISRHGKRTLVVEADICSAIGPLLGVGEHLPHNPVACKEPQLWACNIDPERALSDIATRFVHSPTIARTVVSNPVTRLFFKTAPFVHELAALLHIRHLLKLPSNPERGEFDAIVVDLPSTGHATAFLTAPATARSFLRVGGLARVAGELDRMLRDPCYTTIAIVTLPEELPVREASELYGQLEEQLGPDLVKHIVVNMIRPAPVAEPGMSETLALLSQKIEHGDAELPPGLSALVEGGQRGLHQRDREQELIAQLKHALPTPHYSHIPYMIDADSDPALSKAIAHALADATDQHQI